MQTITSALFRQAAVVPIGAMLIPIFIAFTLDDYSSVSQHISEVSLLDSPLALIQRGAALVTGISIVLFGVASLVSSQARLPFTALAAFLFGSSMISNGIYVMGSPLHGLYGLGLFMALVPAFFAAEFNITNQRSTVRVVSLACAVLSLLYLWLMLSGFDPHGYRGLTQRIATIIIFGWYSFACVALLARQRAAATGSPSAG